MPTAIDLFEKARRHERLERLQAARDHDLMPYFRVLEGPAGPVVEMEGSRRIMLGSNNYLGLTGDERVKDSARRALERYGTGLTGSRFLNGTLELHLELESMLADWMGTEDALVFTTGYLANTGAIGTLLGPGDTVICDTGDHASILDAVSMSRARIRPSGTTGSTSSRRCSRAPRAMAAACSSWSTVFSMEGDLAPIPDVAALCREHGARLMVDEAHGVGVLGARRRRMRGLRRRGRDRPAHGHLLEVACVLRRLRRRPVRRDRLPARPVALLHVHGSRGARRDRRGDGRLEIIRSDEGPQLMAQVLDNARYLHDGLADLGYHVMEPIAMPDGSEVITPIVPVLIGDDWKAVLHWKALYDAGVYVNVAICPPSSAAVRCYERA